MRLFLSALVTALVVPLAAHAQAPKQVEVINDPLAVEVVNPAPVSCDQKRVQVVGVTSAVYNGDLGGHWGATRKCDAEFPGSFFCTDIGEFRKTTSPPPAPGAIAWIDSQGEACLQWTSGLSSRTGGQIDTNTGLGVSGSPLLPCDVEHPLLCCGFR